MEDIINNPSTPNQSNDEEDDEESLEEFNCEPVDRTDHDDTYTSPGPERTRMTSATRELGIRFNSRRKATLHAPIQGFATAYLDQDTSGTYDPKLQRATPEDSPPLRTKKRKAPRALNGNGEQRLKRSLKDYEKSGIIVLKPKTEEGRNYLRSLTPDAQSSATGDELCDSENDSNDSGEGPVKGRRTRYQGTRRITVSSRDDGLTLDQLTNGHPQRRGCKGCFEAGDDNCNLIEDEFHYPCEACDDVGIDCELIIPPEYKKTCERCKRKRIRCSYGKKGGKGVDSCEACEGANEQCCAGPLQKSSLRRYNKPTSQPSSSRLAPHPTPPTPPSAPDRVFVMCNQCRTGSLRCSLKRGQPGPCSNCRKAGDTCKFVVKRSYSITHLANNPNGQTSRGKPSTPSRVPRDQRPGNPHTPTALTNQLGKEVGEKASRSRVSKGKQRSEIQSTQAGSKLIGSTAGVAHDFVTTAFCHPIKFFYLPDPMKKYPCSWCASPVFGLWGHGVKENVEVIPWGGNIGSEEIENGHAADGHQNSRMCMSCTLERIGIMMCARHEIKKIKGLERKLLDPRAIEESLEKMLDGDEEGAELVKQVRWCSICVAPAEFRCHAASEQCPNGCGLLLCLTCADLMERMMRGLTSHNKINVMDQLIKLWESEKWKVDGELRADVDFLQSTGHLKTRLDQEMGISSWDDPQFKSPRAVEKEMQEKLEGGGKGIGALMKWKGKSKDMSYFEKDGGIPQAKTDSGRSFSIPKSNGKGKKMGSFGDMGIGDGVSLKGAFGEKREMSFGGSISSASTVRAKSKSVEMSFGGLFSLASPTLAKTKGSAEAKIPEITELSDSE